MPLSLTAMLIAPVVMLIASFALLLAINLLQKRSLKWLAGKET